MAYRYTNTDKWNDAWFMKLSQIQMLLFLYLCDNCDMAGFIEINCRRWANDLNSSVETIEGAIKGLSKSLTISKELDCIYINNFLKHQKNLPLNPEKNPAHRGIMNRFNLYSYKFDIKDVNDFIEGASKGLNSPIGNGNGIGNGKSKSKGKDINIPFDNFWNLYDYKKGDKTKIEKKWILLKDEERTAIINYLPAYKESTPEKKYRKHPETFLNNKSWNDEIESNSKLNIIKNIYENEN